MKSKGNNTFSNNLSLDESVVIAGRTFDHLRQSNYGENNRMATFGESFELAYGLCIYQGDQGVDNFVKLTSGLSLLGNSAILYTPKMLFVEDIPEVKDGKIIMHKKDLVARLGSEEFKGVRFSKDGRVRAIPYVAFTKGNQTSEQMKKNSLAIALTGDILAPEKLAEIQDKISKTGYINTHDLGSNDLIIVPALCIQGDKLKLDCYWGDVDASPKSSFAVIK